VYENTKSVSSILSVSRFFAVVEMGVSDSGLNGGLEHESLRDVLKRAQSLFQSGRAEECSALLQSVHVPCSDATDRSEAALVQAAARANLAVLSCHINGDTRALTECLDSAAGKIHYTVHRNKTATILVDYWQ
jgi:hypothetical protein